MQCAMPGCEATLTLPPDDPAALRGHGWLVLDWLAAGGVNPVTDRTTTFLPLYFCRLLHVQQWCARIPDDTPMGARGVAGVRVGPLPLSPHPMDAAGNDALLYAPPAADGVHGPYTVYWPAAEDGYRRREVH